MDFAVCITVGLTLCLAVVYATFYLHYEISSKASSEEKFSCAYFVARFHL
jgi:hypothetical protein